MSKRNKHVTSYVKNGYWICILLLITLALEKKVSAQKQTPPFETLPLNTDPYYKWWNLLHYTISIQPDYINKKIQGTNMVKFKALQEGQVMRIDLQDPMQILQITWEKNPLYYKKNKNAYLISFPQKIKKGQVDSIKIVFQGKPSASHKPPFDNGWIWQKDKNNNPWISVACEGSGASIWFPCKETLYDEPDKGVIFNITVPDSLVAVSNGRLTRKINHPDNTVTFQWQVVSPINNYNIIPYIGKYVNWHSNHKGIAKTLDVDFWVLNNDLARAKQHLKQTDTMLNCFEYWLGKYPFYEDGYKLVEAPMPGMEHQSAIAYGNNFKNGYNGYDISGTGWGLKWDFILVHESSHEWFGNSITSCDNRHTWLHEGFAKYMETIYTGYAFGKQAGNAYCIGTWQKIKNDLPIIGNNTSDKYYKASAMLHMIRQITGDQIFKGWLHELNRVYYHSTINTHNILVCLNNYTGMDFTKIFKQYLYTTQVPHLEYYIKSDGLHFRWTNCVPGFAMPIKIKVGKKHKILHPKTKWNTVSIKSSNKGKILIDSNYYVHSHPLN